MIKAGIITPNFSMGGAERWVATLLKYADPAVLQWTGVCISGWGSLDPLLCEDAVQTGVRLFSEPMITKTVPRGRPTPAALSPDCERYVTRLPNIVQAIGEACRGADILLAWGSPQYVSFLKQPNAPKKFVYCSHGSHHKPEEIQQPDWASVHLTAVSERAKRPIDCPGNPPITVIYNGVGQERLYPTRYRDAIRQEWGFDPETKVIAYVGRFSPEKNPQAAIQALAALPPDWAAVHYGDRGALSNLLDQTERLAREQRLQARFYPPISDVGDVYAGSDVVMLASNFEAFSLVMIEAWLCRKPVIATPAGAVPELQARFGKLVIEVPSNPTPADLAEACQRALSPEGDEIVMHAYSIAQKNFTAEVMLQRWVEYFNGI